MRCLFIVFLSEENHQYTITPKVQLIEKATRSANLKLYFLFCIRRRSFGNWNTCWSINLIVEYNISNTICFFLSGFALKFYTEEGIWDLVGNNTPIFFMRDPINFPMFIHSQKRNPVTNLRDWDMFWDWITLRPESVHQVMFLFSDRGIPDGHRHQHGFGSHTFSLIGKDRKLTWCKFIYKTNQGKLFWKKVDNMNWIYCRTKK